MVVEKELTYKIVRNEGPPQRHRSAPGLQKRCLPKRNRRAAANGRHATYKNALLRILYSASQPGARIANRQCLQCSSHCQSIKMRHFGGAPITVQNGRFLARTENARVGLGNGQFQTLSRAVCAFFRLKRWAILASPSGTIAYSHHLGLRTALGLTSRCGFQDDLHLQALRRAVPRGDGSLAGLHTRLHDRQA